MLALIFSRKISPIWRDGKYEPLTVRHPFECKLQYQNTNRCNTTAAVKNMWFPNEISLKLLYRCSSAACQSVSEMSFGLRLDWIRITTNFFGFGLYPDFRIKGLIWTELIEKNAAFLLLKSWILLTFYPSFGVGIHILKMFWTMDLNWVLKIQKLMDLYRKNDSPLITGLYPA